MRRITRQRPSPALVVAVLALFVGLGGTGYAASSLVGGAAKVKKGKRPSALRIANKALKTARVAAGSAAKAQQSANGAQSTATNAQSTATNAQSTADAALAKASTPDAPAGPASGDLTGNYPSPTIADAPPPTAVSVFNSGINTWTSGSPPTYGPLGCYEDRSGFVHLQGAVVQGGTGYAITSSLPAQCPPPPFRRSYTIPVTNGSFTLVDIGTLRVEPNGSLAAQDGANPVPPSYLASLDAVTWRAR